MKFSNVLVLVLGVFGCGGAGEDSFSSTTPAPDVCDPGRQETCPCSDGSEGVQSCNEDGTGYEACSCSSTTSTSSGDGGNGAGGNGVGGSECVPSVTCQSVQAECGTILDDGCGNEVECPDNCVAPLTCGGGGDQFKCGCTPKSCLTLGATCGLIDDTCGNMIDCGGCDPADPNVTCGGAKPNSDGSPGVGEDNVCGGGCVEISSGEYIFACSNINYPPHAIKCLNDVKPNDNCKKYLSVWQLPEENFFCCP